MSAVIWIWWGMEGFKYCSRNIMLRESLGLIRYILPCCFALGLACFTERQHLRVRLDSCHSRSASGWTSTSASCLSNSSLYSPVQ